MLVVSNNVMGRVLFKLHSHSLGFGMGYTFASFHSSGISLKLMHLQMNFHKNSCATGPKCLSISFEINDGPVAFSFGSCLIILTHSSKVGRSIKFL